MAMRGDSAPEILGTFYPYSHIEQLKSLPEKEFHARPKSHFSLKKESKKPERLKRA